MPFIAMVRWVWRSDKRRLSNGVAAGRSLEGISHENIVGWRYKELCVDIGLDKGKFGAERGKEVQFELLCSIVVEILVQSQALKMSVYRVLTV